MTDHLGGFGSLAEASEAVAAYTGRTRPSNPDGMRKNVRLSEDGRWYWHWDPAMMTRADRKSGAPDPERLLRLAAKITVPVLIVRGAESDVVDDAGVRELQETLADSTVIEVASAGHMVAGDDNDRFASATGSFLEQLEDAPQQGPTAA
jgi:pimeloyl-ACP methyl ester carboxylesterase